MSYLFVTIMLMASIAAPILLLRRAKWLLPWVMAGVLMRLFLMFLNHAEVIRVPGSDADALMFTQMASEYARYSWAEILSLADFSSARNYAVVGAILFKLFGYNDLVLPSVNMALSGLSLSIAGLLIYRLFGSSAGLTSAALISLFPFLAFNSVIALREEFAILFFVVGLWYLAVWAERGRITPFMVGSFCFIAAAGVHPGFIGAVLAAGAFFFVMSILALRSRARWQTSFVSLLFSILLVGSALVTLGSGVELAKGMNLSLDVADLSQTVNDRFSRESRGGSAYPEFVTMGEPLKQPWLVPLRAIYFLYSPFPWDVRSLAHVSGVAVSILYLFLTWRAVVSWRRGWFRARHGIFPVIFIVMTLVFAVGTTNSGTAIRHKTKYFPLLVLLAAPALRRKAKPSISFGYGTLRGKRRVDLHPSRNPSAAKEREVATLRAVCPMLSQGVLLKSEETPASVAYVREALNNSPDETTILNFRRLLETHELAPQILERVNAHLARKGQSLRAGTIVDATIIAAPSSTKNKERERDPEMHQTKKGNQWHFGMKAHIGVDDESGLVHHVECTAANVADVTQMHKLLHGKEATVCGDSGYTGADKREELQHVEVGFLIAEKPSKLRAMKNKRDRKYAERWECYKASVRAKVEHPFRVVKRQFGYAKVRYRGLAKNTAQVLTLFALSNLWMARRDLLAAAG